MTQDCGFDLCPKCMAQTATMDGPMPSMAISAQPQMVVQPGAMVRAAVCRALY